VVGLYVSLGVVAMTREEVRRIVFEEVSRAHKAQTGEAPQLHDGLQPVADLARFDSPLAEDVTAVVLLRLSLSPQVLPCPFTGRIRRRFATLNQIVDAFYKASTSAGVPANA
jgi:hypothetical protein